MPKTRGLLNSATVEVAKRQRLCHRNRKNHSITKGELCLVIKDTNMGGKKNYCSECAAEIFKVVDDDLARLRADLGQ